MYSYFYLDQNNQLSECDHDTYYDWAFDIYDKNEVSHFYIKEMNALVECPNKQMYDTLASRYGNGDVVCTSQFATLKSGLGHQLPIVHTVETKVEGIEYDDIDFLEKPYYPIFTVSVTSQSEQYHGHLVAVNRVRLGLDRANEIHSSIVLDIIAGHKIKK